MAETLYFEDFPQGETVRLDASFTVTRDDIITFAEQYDPQPMHLSEEGGKASILGGLAASGWQTCAIAMRLISDGYVTRTAGAGASGIEEGKWLKPVRPGDTLHMTRETMETRYLNSRPGVGMCKFRWTVLNQNDEPVLEIVGNQMFVTREGAAAGVRY